MNDSPPRVEKDWTPTEMTELTQMYGSKTSIRRIAEYFKVSRNAITGKAHRMKLPPRPNEIRDQLSDGYGALAARRVVSVGPPPRSCRFPLWDFGAKPDHRYCGAPVTERRRRVVSGTLLSESAPVSYCKEHYGACSMPKKNA